ncbi:hypothetical protein O2V63_18455 [Modestobacter sp. VKM Ac-2977]|uniref:hypothetical protein n=1 Tax=Modestobacter sp. VKM Ac-2977 TaxID=3004131 RepID=UPI0022AB2EBF|nr:hypothetical protein [Modestobacter sp. VKM Ac-2977]MCZ2822326.1 hypothetical protein [Modestobacter sp. VKM Ac-2977]
MESMRIAGRVVSATVPLLCLVACTTGESDASASGESSTAAEGAAESSRAAALLESDLPGDEALSPPPPDPAAPTLLTQLNGLTVGTFRGTVDLAVSGLTAFAEPVQGRCTQTPDGRGFELVLSDGSQLTVSFGPDGGASRLAAPGIDVEQTLHDVDLEVSGDLELTAGLYTGGTTEPSGSLTLSGTCA